MEAETVKDVNPELEGNSCRWDAEQGRWIEPDECEDVPTVSSDSWPPLPDVEDKGGNVAPDRVKANHDQYGPEHD